MTALSRLAFIGNSLPRRCGIATFTTDLCDALEDEFPALDCFVLAMNDAGKQHAYPPRVRFELEILRAEPGFAPDARGSLQKKLAHLLPGAPAGISFGSEASRLARVAREVIVIGPGDMTTAHSSRECVPVVELEAWTATLAQLLRG